MFKSNDQKIYLRDVFPTVKASSTIMHGANRYLNIGLQGISACSNLTSNLNMLETRYPTLEKLRTFNKILKDIYVRNLSITEHQIFQYWNRPGQQDSYDLLAYVINDVYSEFPNEFNEFQESLNRKLPMQISLEVTCCPDCNNEKSFQYDLALDISIIKKPQLKSTDLQDLLESYFNEEIINEKCENSCRKKRRKLCFVPSTLCIRLRRLYWINEKLEIICDRVEFKEELTIQTSNLTTRPMKISLANNQTYHLKSVIAQNPNDSFEHNICYKLMNNTWFCVTDSTVHKEDFNNVLNCIAYVLFYEVSPRPSADINLRFNIQNRKNLILTRDINDGIRNPYITAVPSMLPKPNSVFTKTFKSPIVAHEKSLSKREICRFKMFQSDMVLIKALSNCTYFVESLKLVNCESMEERYQQIVKSILNRSRSSTRIIANKDVDILGNFKKFLAATFSIKFNSSITKLEEENKVQCPISISVMSEIKCKCTETTFNVIKSKFGLKVFNFCINLQRSIDFIFNVEKEVTFKENNKKCDCTSGYSKSKLSQPIPKTICVYSENECRLFQIKLLKELVIRNSYFSQSLIDVEGVSGNRNDRILENNDHKYFLRSIIFSLDSDYECYQIRDNRWYHFKNNKLNEVDESSNIFGKWHILFYEKVKETDKTKHDFKKTGKPSVISPRRICVENAMMRNVFDFEYNSKTINSSNKAHYLQISLHAFSSCKKFVNEIQNVITDEMEKSNLFMKNITLLLQSFEYVEIPLTAVNELQLHDDTNIFQFLMNLLSDLSKEWKTNPFLISRRITIRCCLCETLQEDDLNCNLSFNIPVTSSIEFIDIQHIVNSNFKIEILKNFDCVKKDCGGKESKMLSRLCLPFPTVICIHIVRVVWDGVKNVLVNSNIRISEQLQLKLEYLDYQSSINYNNKDLIYILQSVISFTESGVQNEYICFKKLNGDWYKITKSSTLRVNKNEMMECKPYIMFYELTER